jgi:hypothetical protein
MSGEDTFIARWSRLKQKAAEEKQQPRAATEGERRQPLPDAAAKQEAPRSSRASAVPGDAEPAFDPATLPPIESIVAGTDIRAFLQKGVPAALTRAALRRAWTADPAIRDFIEVAENQWDFANPTSIPGFGPLQATDNLRQLVGQALGNLPQAAPDVPDPRGVAGTRGEDWSTAASADPQEPPTAPKADHGAAPPATVEAAANRAQVVALPETPDRPEMDAPQQAEPAQQVGSVPRRKGHGGAMPR